MNNELKAEELGQAWIVSGAKRPRTGAVNRNKGDKDPSSRKTASRANTKQTGPDNQTTKQNIQTSSKDRTRTQRAPRVGTEKSHASSNACHMENGIRSILQILTIFGLVLSKKESENEVKKTGESWRKAAEQNGCDWMKWSKYKLAAFFSFHTDQVLPPAPNPFNPVNDKVNYLVGGKAGQFLRTLLRTEFRMEILSSLLQAKRGFPRPTREMVKTSVQSTFDKLTAPAPALEKMVHFDSSRWSDASSAVPPKVEGLLSRFTMQLEIQRTVRELFAGVEISPEEKTRAFFPSTSANYIRSRDGLGAVGAILDSGIINDLRVPGGVTAFEKTLLIDSNITVKDNGETEVTMSLLKQEAVVESTTNLRNSFNILLQRLTAAAAAEIADGTKVSLVGLEEALKVRVISKGPPALYTVLRGIWSAIFQRLKRHPTFELIGTPITEWIVQEALGATLKESDSYLSVDYADATNGMKAWASEACVNSLADTLNLSQEERNMFLASLTGASIENPLTGEFKKQQWGQLMGAITSFVVLCIINATVCRWALEVSLSKPIKLRDAPLRVNGDDAMMKGPTGRLMSVWEEIAKLVGLNPSIGKVFQSREFVNINSTNFQREHAFHLVTAIDRRDNTKSYTQKCHFRETPFINVGLIHGHKRSGKFGLSGQDPRETFGAKVRKLVDKAPFFLQESVLTEFIKHNREKLESVRPIPWFIPEWLGGIGLPAIGKWQPSKKDLRIAARIMLNWRSIRPQNANPSDGWQIRKLAMKRLPALNPVPEGHPAIEATQRVSNDASINLLFDSNVTKEKLYVANTAKASRAISFNRKLWTPTSMMPAPMPLEALLPIKRYEAFSSVRDGQESLVRNEDLDEATTLSFNSNKNELPDDPNMNHIDRFLGEGFTQKYLTYLKNIERYQ